MLLTVGPCQLESVDHALKMAEIIGDVADKIGNRIVFKASFDKANRTSGSSARGAGIDVAEIAFRRVREDFGLEVLTDVHETSQCARIAPYVDIIQIPALLSRQTDLVATAARTGLKINIKKGQFMAPGDMFHAVTKAREAGAETVYVTERGTTFGYGDLVVDMRSIPIMSASGADGVIFDCTHSVQSPGSLNGSTGGAPEFTETLARAAIAAGADGLFLETHNDPANAPSDGAVMMPSDRLYDFLARMVDLYTAVQGL